MKHFCLISIIPAMVLCTMWEPTPWGQRQLQLTDESGPSISEYLIKTAQPDETMWLLSPGMSVRMDTLYSFE